MVEHPHKVQHTHTMPAHGYVHSKKLKGINQARYTHSRWMKVVIETPLPYSCSLGTYLYFSRDYVNNVHVVHKVKIGKILRFACSNLGS